METTANFAAGLRQAYKELEQEGRIKEEDRKIVGTLIEHPVMTGPDGKKIFGMQRTHRRVRRFYCRQKGVRFIADIDWTSLVGWLKENWLSVLKIIISILPFLVV